MLKRLLLIVTVLAIGAVLADGAKPRSSTAIKNEQKNTRSEIKNTKNRIDKNKKATQQKLDNLGELRARIDKQVIGIDSLNRRVAQLDTSITRAADQVSRTNDTVNVLRQDLKESLKAMRTRRRLKNNVAFIFSAQSFNQAFKRIEYVEQLNQWRQRKIVSLKEAMARLEQQKAGLEKLRSEKSTTLAQLNAGKQTLEVKRKDEEIMLGDLRKESTQLNALLKKQQQRLRQLDNELDRIIALEQQRAEEQRRAEERRRAQENKKKGKDGKTQPTQPQQGGYADADRKLSGSFEANRGQLLFPVAGKYTIVSTFGRSQHRTLSNIEVNNSGIDIAVVPGTKARAVFGGTVSSVFFMNGFQNIVMIRHGQYITVYAGLTGLTVKKGQQVTAGQTLGTVYTDNDDAARTVLHFEVRRERQKLNPTEWVR